jgi:hypothetical protein
VQVSRSKEQNEAERETVSERLQRVRYKQCCRSFADASSTPDVIVRSRLRRHKGPEENTLDQRDFLLVLAYPEPHLQKVMRA